MLIVTITEKIEQRIRRKAWRQLYAGELPKGAQSHFGEAEAEDLREIDRQVFRFEAAELDVPALVRATLEAAAGAAADRRRRAALERIVQEISTGQYCAKGCARTATNVVRALLDGGEPPRCGGHVAGPTE